MLMRRSLQVLVCVTCLGGVAKGSDWHGPGPLFDDFSLTLDLGHRTEVVGPFYYSEQKETQHTWALPLLGLEHVVDPGTESEEWDFCYPVLTYDRYGAEYRWQFFQLFSFAGGANQDASKDRRFTLYPFYFQQRSTNPSHNYTALVPLYGHLDHRLFHDQIDFVLFPLYAKTHRKDVVTYNMPYPFFHLRQGNGLKGWQFFPIVGMEHKELTTLTNNFGDVTSVGGHDHRFVLWPFFTSSLDATGTEQAAHIQTLFPLYSFERSALRHSTSYGWPLGFTHVIDREKKYEEWDAPWPLVEFAHGEGKTTRRIWPLFSQSRNEHLESDWYLWPIWKYAHFVSEPLDRERSQIFFFFYSSVKEKNLETGKSMRRVDLWPLFTYRRGHDQKERLQVLSIIEPVLPNNKSIERDYAPIYSLWRDEKNPKTGAQSQSLLWNLYRRETSPEGKKCSLLFGLVQYNKSVDGTQWRVGYVTLGKRKQASAPPQ